MGEDSRFIAATQHAIRFVFQTSAFVPAYAVLAVRLWASNTTVTAGFGGLGGSVGLPLASLTLILFAVVGTALYRTTINGLRKTGNDRYEVVVDHQIRSPVLGSIGVALLAGFVPLDVVLLFVAVTFAVAPMLGDDLVAANPLTWLFGYVPYRVTEQSTYSKRIVLAERGSLHEVFANTTEDEEILVMVTTASGRRTLVDGRYTYSKELGYTPLPTTRKLLRLLGKETHPKRLNEASD